MHALKVWLEGDGIMRTEHPVHSSITSDYLKELLCRRRELSTDRHQLLVKLNGLVAFSTSAQRFLAEEEFSAITEAIAVIVSPDAGYYRHTKILLGLFKTQSDLSYPVEYFDTEAEAVTWLKSLVKEPS